MKNIFRTLKLAFLVSFETVRRNLILFGSIFFIVCITLILQLNFKVFGNPNSISLGFIGTYQEHDLPEEVGKLLSTGLVQSDSEGRIKGNLVSGWETNNDATVFKFKLKDNLKWADGSEVKSGDLVINIPNVEVSTPDSKTLEFKLKESYSPLPSLLTKPIFKRGSMMGMGPYKITDIEKSRVFITKIKLKAGDPKLPSIDIRFYPSEKVAVTGMNLGEIQVLLGFLDKEVFSGNHKVAVSQKKDNSKIVTVLFSMDDPLVGSKNRSLRQALSFVTPSVKNEEIANNPYPQTLWAYDSSSKKYLDNPTEAKEALKRAESQMSKDMLDDEIILTSTPNLEGVGKQIVEAWRTLGFDAKLRVESGIPQNFQALLITQSIPIDPDQYFLWHATQIKTNLTKYNSQRADKDLEDGRKTITEEDRKIKYFDFQKSLLEDAPAIFLYFPKYNVAYLQKKEAVLKKIIELQ